MTLSIHLTIDKQRDFSQFNKVMNFFLFTTILFLNKN